MRQKKPFLKKEEKRTTYLRSALVSSVAQAIGRLQSVQPSSGRVIWLGVQSSLGSSRARIGKAWCGVDWTFGAAREDCQRDLLDNILYIHNMKITAIVYIYIQYMFISILYCIMLYYITYSIHCCRLQRSFRFDQRRASRNPPRRCWHVRSWLVIQGWKGVGHTRFGPFRSFGCFFKGNLAVASNLVPIESGKSEKMHRFCYWELSSCRAFFTYHTPPDWCECQVLKRSLFIFVWDTRVEQLWRL